MWECAAATLEAISPEPHLVWRAGALPRNTGLLGRAWACIRIRLGNHQNDAACISLNSTPA